MKRSSHGLKLKIQIDVNCGSCECQFKGFSVKGESPTVLLSREVNEAMTEKDKKRLRKRVANRPDSISVAGTLTLYSELIKILN